MEHDTITISQATALAAPEPPVVMPPAELELLGNQIAELSARIDAATYELLCHLHEFDRRYGWEGWRSCAHWLNWRTGLDLGAAREKLRVAAALADLNHVSAAMARGQLSYSKVRALTRVASPATDARLLAVALSATAAQVERLVRAWRRVDRDAQPDAEQVLLASRALSMQVDEDGMVVLRGRLPPEVGAVLLRAVEAAMEQVPASADGGEPTIAQRRADALGLVAESALAGGLDPGNLADRFQVTVHVQADALPALPATRPTQHRAVPRKRARAACRRRSRSRRPRALSRSKRPLPRLTLPRKRSRSAKRPANLRLWKQTWTPAWPSSSRRAASTWARRRPAAWPAMPASWCCATPPMVRFWTSGAGAAPSRALCTAPCSAGTVICRCTSPAASTRSAAVCAAPTPTRPTGQWMSWRR